MSGGADVSISGLTVTDARRQAIDFSVPIIWSDLVSLSSIKKYNRCIDPSSLQSVFIANPREEFRYTTYLTPLHKPNWLILTGFMLFGTAALALTAKKAKAENSKEEFTLSKCLTFR